MFNTYTDEFRRNAVAVVRSGYGISNLAKRLHVPPSSIRNWLANPKYSDVPPAQDELLAMLPRGRDDFQGLVQLGRGEAFLNENALPMLKIRVGQVEIETPQNISTGSFRLLIETLREAHVL